MKKITRADLYRDITEEDIMRELFGNAFADYLTTTRKGHADPRTPLKIFFALKQFAQAKLESTRLITVKKMQQISSVNDQLLRRHIMNFVTAGILTEHRVTQHLAGNKKEVTYTVKPYSEWNKDLEVDIQNHISLLVNNDNG